jgi:hypothetical protein
MLADRPIDSDDGDRLGFRPYADALAELIDNPSTYTPLTLAISAPWGAGKTSLAKLVERRLRDWPVARGEKAHVVCWFGAWMHDDAPHLGAAFAAEVAKQANRARPRWRRLLQPLPSEMLSSQERWRRRCKLALAALALALPIALLPGVRDLFGSFDVDKVRAAFGATLASVASVLLVVYAGWSKLFAAAQVAARFVDDPASEAARGAMAEVRGQLGRLIAQATKERKLVIFVDDLERCRPPRALDVCETAAQLLSHPSVVTVLVADMAAIAASASIKYGELEGKYTPRGGTGDAMGGWLDYGRFYLQKLVQIQFDLPLARPEALREMLEETTA